MVVELRPLQGERAEMAALQRVLEGAPRYAELITGAPPGPADAQSTYSALPEGKWYDDKFVFGIYCGADMVGCADLIRGYPDPHTAWLGLLLVAEAFERRGFGSAACRELEAVIRSWGSCQRIRLSVVRVNAQALRFWRKVGFAPTGETKPYRYGALVSEHILLEKRLY
jgi:RimJ/RimL family protein N-acetyltransferase